MRTKCIFNYRYQFLHAIAKCFMRMEFSALNVDFNGSSLDFLGSRKPANEGIKKTVPPVKVAIFPMLASLS